MSPQQVPDLCSSYDVVTPHVILPILREDVAPR
jgi:hypothetical protein